MVRKLIATLSFIFLLSTSSDLLAQSYDSLTNRILAIEAEVQEIQLNINTSQKKFKSGILVATIGYATTITGGLMLGRKNDSLGQTLLVTGGAIGAFGTYKMVDAFGYLSGRKRKKK